MTINLFGASMRAKGVMLRKEMADVVPAMNSDRMKMQSIIKNLLSNAIKFTQEGEIVVWCGVHPSMPAWVRIQVSDTGIGIAPADQEIIIDEFRQVDGSSTRSFGGTGLGLAIAKRYVTLLGGTITVASAPGKGSVFTVDVPVELTMREDTDTTWSAP